MPPKGWKKYADGFRPATSQGEPVKSRPVYSLDDLLLPRTTVTKLAKQALPPNTPLPKDGVTALMRGATVFINYLCGEANRLSQLSGRKTISQADIEAALHNLHLGAFIGTVQQEVEATVARVAAAKEARKAGNAEGTVEEDGGAAQEELEELSEDSESESMRAQLQVDPNDPKKFRQG